MGLELVFTAHPDSTEHILFGIQEKATVDELATLYQSKYATLVAGDICLEMPSNLKVKSLQIKSAELKHLFANYEGKVLCILNPDPKSLKNPSQTLRLP